MNEAFQALEMLVEERRLASRPGRIAVDRERWGDAADEMRARLAHILAAAAPYYWASEQCFIIDHVASSVPRTWKPRADACESSAGLFFFAVSFGATPPEEPVPVHPLRALAWAATPEGIDAVWYVQLDTTPGRGTLVPGILLDWPWSTTLGTMLDDAEGIPDDPKEFIKQHGVDALKGKLEKHLAWSQGIHILASAFAFLEQRIFVVREERAPRAVRRRLPAAAATDMIHVVTLRRQVRLPAPPSEPEGEQHPVDWSCRWIVRGHWRNQWFPKTEEHRPMWILPYGKGPEEKPLKMPGTKLFAVVR
jgi:hypothetical protein